MRKFSPENRCCAGFEAVAVPHNTAQKMKFSIKGFFSKCDQIRWKFRIWSPLLNKSLMENSIFCAMIIYKTALDFLFNLHSKPY